MSMLPASYASPLHLPFNQTCLDGRFRLSPPDSDPGSEGLWLVVRGSDLLVMDEIVAPILPRGDCSWGEGFYLGSWDGQPCRVIRIPCEDPVPAGMRAESLVAADPNLPIELLSLGGLARMVLHWESHSRCCSSCGHALKPLPGEWGKCCPACHVHQFPLIAPCAIVLVRRKGEVLLTRKPEWAPNRYSLVAGFVEFGECLEEAAIREVLEETGVSVANLKYLGSQCWPFPSQLMCGFTAEYVGGDVVVDSRELADARWFPCDALPNLPPKRSIARFILDAELGLI